jgi:hypothetical protein
MPNPWDAPSLPSAGDLDPELTYLGVGRIMSAWETIEFDLCMIHSVFLGNPGGEAMRLYGAKRTLRNRLDDFGSAAWDYFIRHPNQEKEGRLHALLVEVKGYVDRRNEVAHGVVLRISNLDFYRQYLTCKDEKPFQFAVIPPYHMVRSHGADGFPLYAYTSNELTILLEKMTQLHDRLADYRKSFP